MERLLTGYQENLITLEELRCRMPELRKQQRAIEAELQSLKMTTIDQTRNLRLVETLAQFRTRLRARGNVLEVTERQRVVRLLVQEILVSGENRPKGEVRPSNVTTSFDSKSRFVFNTSNCLSNLTKPM